MADGIHNLHTAAIPTPNSFFLTAFLFRRDLQTFLMVHIRSLAITELYSSLKADSKGMCDRQFCYQLLLIKPKMSCSIVTYHVCNIPFNYYRVDF